MKSKKSGIVSTTIPLGRNEGSKEPFVIKLPTSTMATTS
jgi:hypothetical protein